MTIRVVADNSCDLLCDIEKKFKISIILFNKNIGYEDYQDDIDLHHKQFYELLPQIIVLPKTAAPGIKIFSLYYNDSVREGAIGSILIHVSKRLSNSLDIARIAAQQCMAKSMVVFDSGQLAFGVGFLVIEAA